MSDEYSIDAKYKRDNLIDEHYRYQRALEQIVSERDELRELLRGCDDALAEALVHTPSDYNPGVLGLQLRIQKYLSDPPGSSQHPDTDARADQKQ